MPNDAWTPPVTPLEDQPPSVPYPHALVSDELIARLQAMCREGKRDEAFAEWQRIVGADPYWDSYYADHGDDSMSALEHEFVECIQFDQGRNG